MKSLKNLITAPAEALLSTPEDPQVFQDIELVYSEMQQNKTPFGSAFHGNKSLDWVLLMVNIHLFDLQWYFCIFL